MKNDLFYSTKQAVKYWWISLLIGLLAVGLGIWCMATPLSTLVALVLVFAVTFFVSGLFEIAFAISNRKLLRNWGWTLASGILDLAFGIILIAMPPEVIALVMAYFVGFWVMFQSVWGIGTAAELQRNGVKGWGWLMALAILGVLMAFIFIVSPAFTTTFIIALVSISFIFYGIFRIYYAFRLRSLHKELDELDKS
ncbi:MAG: HdeD family acid-resistance protein [Dysgonomonas sp.]